MIKKAYAKINLSLKVLGTREDGYHDLDTIMININLFDKLIFKKSDAVKVNMNIDIGDVSKNIVYKTVMLLKEKYKISQGIDIYIKKNIPMGAGLGGGSSDAAQTILALDKIWELNLSEQEKIENAKKIGADVPFFLFNKIARVRGIGEKIDFLNKNVYKKVILVCPNLNCSTKEVYSKWHNSSSYNIDDIDYVDFNNIFNDLEQATLEAYPLYKLNEIKNNLKEVGCTSTLMSGSGSSVFGLYDKVNKSLLRRKLAEYDIVYCKTISCCKK